MSLFLLLSIDLLPENTLYLLYKLNLFLIKTVMQLAEVEITTWEYDFYKPAAWALKCPGGFYFATFVLLQSKSLANNCIKGGNNYGVNFPRF